MSPPRPSRPIPGSWDSLASVTDVSFESGARGRLYYHDHRLRNLRMRRPKNPEPMERATSCASRGSCLWGWIFQRMSWSLNVFSPAVVQRHLVPSPDFIFCSVPWSASSRVSSFGALAITITCSSVSSMHSISMLRGSLCSNSALDCSMWGRNCRTLASTMIVMHQPAARSWSRW